MNGAQSEASQKLSNAIGEWLEERGRALDKGSKNVKLSTYCQIVDILYKIFFHYVTKSLNKCCKISHIQGPAPLLKWEDQQYVVNVLTCCNSFNIGCNVTEAFNIVQGFSKKETQKRACQHVKNYHV